MGIPVGLAAAALERMDKRDAALVAANMRIMELECALELVLAVRMQDNLSEEVWRQINAARRK